MGWLNSGDEWKVKWLVSHFALRIPVSDRNHKLAERGYEWVDCARVGFRPIQAFPPHVNRTAIVGSFTSCGIAENTQIGL
jgi:hypothetical protein